MRSSRYERNTGSADLADRTAFLEGSLVILRPLQRADLNRR